MITNLSPSLFIEESYPLTLTSLTVYLISTPLFLYLGKLPKVYLKPLLALSSTSLTFSPSAFKITVILSGLIPSLLLSSFHTFVTVFDTTSGTCLLVIS